VAATEELQEQALRHRPSWAVAGPRSFAPLVVGVLFALFLHFVVGKTLGQFRAKILLDIGINVILAVSLNMVNGFTGQFSIGHGGFMAVGGYVAGAVTYYGSLKIWGDTLTHSGGDALFLASCLLGGLAAAGAGWVVGLPSLRLRGDYLAIVTLGFGEIVRVLLQLTMPVIEDTDGLAATPTWEVPLHLGGPLGFTGLPYYANILWVWCFVALTIVAAYRLKTSSWGRAFLAVRENEVAAEAMGIHTTKVKVRAFVLSAFFAGSAGGLFAHSLGSSLNSGELGFMKSFDVIIMVVLGGMGSISGAVLAAIVLTVLPEALRSFESYRMVVYALSLILMMILRPQGLFGVREIWELGPFRRLFLDESARRPA
jgi:branched-chain amino acid transport system permease protein